MRRRSQLPRRLSYKKVSPNTFSTALFYLFSRNMSRRYFQKRERKLLLMTASNKQTKDGDPVSRLLLIQNAIDKKVSPFAVCVLGRPLTHYNHKTGRCDPSEKTLAEHFDVSEKKVWRAIKELKDTKFIFVEHRYKANNLYQFNWSKAVKIDLKKTHSGRTPVSYQSDILDGQNQHSGRTKSALWTTKLSILDGHQCPTNSVKATQ